MKRLNCALKPGERRGGGKVKAEGVSSVSKERGKLESTGYQDNGKLVQAPRRQQVAIQKTVAANSL